ncbi:MAG TPA: FAD-dependent oxidoreductase [Dermatophilaceae bacterium]|nr:FAD-dependent oxidoreductase [Dermatophilaceae bacterium]
MMDTFAIVGGGLAAAKAVEGLRSGGFTGRIVLVAAERHLPYERPPLSKGYLLGHQDLDRAFVHPPQWYLEHQVDLRLGSTATGIDRGAHTVATDEGDVRYDRLLLATGASPRRLPMVDASGASPAYLRTMEDSQRLKAALQPGRRVVAIGGGWIGLEVAAAAVAAGCEVVVLEALELPLVRVLGREVAEVFAGLHRDHGVDLRTNTSVTSVEDDDGRALVRLGDGASVAADLLVVAVGVLPDTALAEAAGLPVDDGIVVDEHLRTADPDVFAAGDVARAYHPRLRRHLRVEHWDNAIEQGLTAARNMTGADEAYTRLPYFFTDQYDLGIEYVGSVGPDGYDEVVLRGDVTGRRFTALWVKDGTAVAGMHANDWDAVDDLRRVVGADAVDPAALRDPSVPLAALTG